MAKKKATSQCQPIDPAIYSMECMGQTSRVVADAMTRRPKANWQRSLPEIADAAFSDAFHGMCAVAIGQKPAVGAGELVAHFMGAMRRVMEDRERSWGARSKLGRRVRRASGVAHE